MKSQETKCRKNNNDHKIRVTWIIMITIVLILMTTVITIRKMEIKRGKKKGEDEEAEEI